MRSTIAAVTLFTVCATVHVSSGYAQMQRATNRAAIVEMTRDAAAIFTAQSIGLSGSGSTYRYIFRVNQILKGKQTMVARHGTNIAFAACSMAAISRDEKESVVPAGECMVFMSSESVQGTGHWSMYGGDPRVAFLSASTGNLAIVKATLDYSEGNQRGREAHDKAAGR